MQTELSCPHLHQTTQKIEPSASLQKCSRTRPCGRYREAAPGWLCVNQLAAVAAALREAGANQLAAAAAAALPDTPPHYR